MGRGSDGEDVDPAAATEVSVFARGERPWLHTILMIVGPLGLLVAISLSLWVSTRRVERSVVVQVEPQWVSGERMAARAQLLDGKLVGVESVAVDLTLFPNGDDEGLDLGTLTPVEGAGVAQGMVRVPTIAEGPARLELTFRDPERADTVESVDVEVVSRREARDGKHTISSSTLQYGDDTAPQPERVRIDLRPFGRILAGFDNRFMVRVTDAMGRPWQGPVTISLVHGELAGKFGALVGSSEAPPTLVSGETDAAGLIELRGVLSSEVVRFEVAVEHAPPELPSRRNFRLVSFPGGVQLRGDPLVAQPDDTFELRPRALRARRPVFLDVHGPDGAWIDTLPPAVPGRDVALEWQIPGALDEGFVQVEAYHYTNAPGEGSAVARVFVSADDLDDARGLAPLIEAQRELLDVPRVEKSFDPELERAHLEALEAAELDGASLGRARAWLIGSLPLHVYGPPTALSTREREDQALAEFKRRWTLGLRWLLLGGGLGFIAVTGLSLFWSYREVARRTAEVLGDDAESVAEASRAMLARAAYVTGLLVVTLLLTLLLLENLVFEF